MEISVRNRQRSIKTDLKWIERAVAAALKELSSARQIRGRNLASGLSFDPMQASLGITLVGDAAMRRLNMEYRGKDRTTDVLSFSQLEGPGIEGLAAELGDIIISPAQAERQAAERGHSFKTEMKALLVHGLLHLIGYDHEIGAAEQRKMKAKERELLDAIKKVG